RQLHRLTVANDGQLDRLVERQAGDYVLQHAAILDRLAVDVADDVARLQLGLGGRRIVEHFADDHAGILGELQALGDVGRQVGDLHAEITAVHDAVLLQAGGHAFGEVAGDGEADALEAAAAALDGRVDADRLAVEAHERAAGVARVD